MFFKIVTDIDMPKAPRKISSEEEYTFKCFM